MLKKLTYFAKEGFIDAEVEAEWLWVILKDVGETVPQVDILWVYVREY